MNVLAIIPARGGSKGIPRKNLIPLAGRPLVAYSIETARQAKGIHRVVVSTEDPEIAAVSRGYGAEVVERPVQISGDNASSESALLHVLEHLQWNENYTPDLIVFLQCTSPLTQADDIEGTVESLWGEDADSALAVTPFHHFLWNRTRSGEALGINHDKAQRLLRQDREPQYLETGAVYVMRTSGFVKSRHRFFGKTALHVVPSERSLEIDDANDLKVAEILLRERINLDRAGALPAKIGGVVFDFDGVFTDNFVIVSQNGVEAVKCNRSDGWGISQLKKLGIPILVLSTEQNSVVKARADKLGIECRQGMHEKLPVLLDWLSEHKLDARDVVYVGNDMNDVPCMTAVGCGVAVNDAYPGVKANARIVLSASGGQGAVRELIDMVLQTKPMDSCAKDS
jgi:N-acylneuraminate cytidylyltransferase